jgi:hypothetical protein
MDEDEDSEHDRIRLTDIFQGLNILKQEKNNGIL